MLSHSFQKLQTASRRGLVALNASTPDHYLTKMDRGSSSRSRFRFAARDVTRSGSFPAGALR
jgi:hypothetical protein